VDYNTVLIVTGRSVVQGVASGKINGQQEK